jgi:hypothetical protein
MKLHGNLTDIHANFWGGLRRLTAQLLKFWGGLEPIGPIAVYAYESFLASRSACPSDSNPGPYVELLQLKLVLDTLETRTCIIDGVVDLWCTWRVSTT